MCSFVENGKLVMLSEFVNISFLTISFFQALRVSLGNYLLPVNHRQCPRVFQVVADL